ncbi:ribosome rescue GTPase HflX [Candidatus Albibeggiatoa sp. nov. NOAA]|uniref:ribosome rescue GTPase HflX n=1 Tax=Candidatus Albibeggiatoa sp. nov. NOAA TaxID=3162724 RepID=UPI0032F4B555|nr:GTPase HflX [Thiotrichaceae bacterium]
MFERPRSGERAILVHIKLNSLSHQADLGEFVELATSAGAVCVDQLTGKRDLPHPAYFIGKGKLEELKNQIEADEIELVIFNHTLSPSQERNLEAALQCRVLDRAGLILDIFAQRARTFEGKLQVELAQLKHLSTRLIRGWTHLERQKGGIGLRGPGETQLETDRRLLGERIKQLNKQLDKVSQQRDLSRRARKRADVPVIALVGYTNAGKSTLFNHLTNAQVYAEDQLFATLDTTMRQDILEDKTKVIFADTVGFIQQLPHDLIAAFRATLEETCQATVLLHVVDASDPERLERIEQVNEVLEQIGADEVPQIMVYNKIDRMEEIPRTEQQGQGEDVRTKIWLSAKTGEGIPLLQQAVQTFLHPEKVHCCLRLSVSEQSLRSRLFTETIILKEDYADNGDSLLELSMHIRQFAQLAAGAF